MNVRSSHEKAPIAVLVIASVLTVGACNGSSGASAPDRRRAETTSSTGGGGTPSNQRGLDAAYAKPGPYGVGIDVFEAGTGPIVVFYPAPVGAAHGRPRATYDGREATRDPAGPPLAADPAQLLTIDAYRDVEVADGRFPVILFSHGYGAVPLINAALEIRLAAWGFVVIAPDHRERDTFALVSGRATVNDRRDADTLVHALREVAARPRISSHLNLGEVAAVGHSQGGGTALAALALPEITTAVTWASTPPSSNVLAKPVMLIGADHDLGYGAAVQRSIYDRLRGPRRLVLLGSGAGHGTFVDLCARLYERHSLPPSSRPATSVNRFIALAENGCHPDEVDPRVAWAAIVHFTVAQLRAVFRIDSQPVGLAPGVTRAFPKINITYRAS